MVSQVTLDPDLDERVIITSDPASVNAEEVFRRAQMLVIDDTIWDADIALIQSALIHRRRAFKAPFTVGDPSPELTHELKRLGAHADRLFKTLYPSFKPIERRDSFRQLITGPEPLHYDTHPRMAGTEMAFVTSFVNVSKVPRVYNISHNFERLVQLDSKLMQTILKNAGKNIDDLSYALRSRTVSGLAPLGPKAPRHRVELAPSSIWFFNPKTVSHEVVYGEGAMSFSWVVPETGALSQRQIMETIR